MVKDNFTSPAHAEAGRLFGQKAMPKLEPGFVRAVTIRIPCSLSEGAKMGWQAMAGKVSMKPVGDAEQNFADWADAWVDRNCHLPPGGDHSWREREAQRIFGDNAEESDAGNEYPPSAGWADAKTDEADASYESGFRRPRTARTFIFPISLAVFAVLAGGYFMLPGSLQSSFWGAREPKALPAPAPIAHQVAVKKEMPGPAPDIGSNLAESKLPSLTSPQHVKQGTAPAKATAPPLLRPPVTEKHEVQRRISTAHVAKVPPPKKQAARSLPPIGSTYFKHRAPAASAKKQVVTALPPIGQAYFESHSPAAAN
jgi:hypothetical protein